MEYKELIPAFLLGAWSCVPSTTTHESHCFNTHSPWVSSCLSSMLSSVPEQMDSALFLRHENQTANHMLRMTRISEKVVVGVSKVAFLWKLKDKELPSFLTETSKKGRHSSDSISTVNSTVNRGSKWGQVLKKTKKIVLGHSEKCKNVIDIPEP